MYQRFPKLFIVLLGFLFVLNLGQATFTELLFDEAYYWYYSKTMAWGYFDHPPMVAAMVRLGEFFLDGELGVRLISCLMGVGTYLLLWGLIENSQKKKYTIHFFLLLFSMALVNAYGFFTLPDTPLLFFTSLFLYFYKKFIGRESVLNAICLGLVMAALLYSKYHGVLIIFFVFASNWRLALNKFAWLAVLIAGLCFTPHLIWLLNNDFLTINYHLFERPNHAYSFTEFTLGYFLNLILVFGLLFPWAYNALIKTKSNGNLFIKALLFLSYGIIAFFFLSSFTKRIQTQWIVIICIPIGLLTFKYLIENKNTAKWIFRMGIVSTFLLFYVRIWLVNDRLLPIYFETHGNKAWVNDLSHKTNQIPIVFQNSYRNASMYAFYSGNPSFSLNTTEKRQNQYSIDGSESKIQGEKVAYVARNIEEHDFEYLKTDGTTYKGKFINAFSSYRKLWCSIGNQPLTLSQLSNLDMTIYNPYDENIPLKNLELYVAYLNKYKEPMDLKKIKYSSHSQSPILNAKDTLNLRCSVPIPEDVKVHYIRFGISENGLKAGINSKFLKLNK